MAKLTPERRNQIRHEAREACAAILMAALDSEDVLAPGTVDWIESEKDEFASEVERVIGRIRR